MKKETYTIKIIDLETGEEVADVLEETDGDCEWGKDDETIFYARMDSAHRPHELWAHTMGTKPDDDVKLFTESDELFWLGFGKARSSNYILMSVGSKETTEIYILELDGQKPDPSNMILISPREYGVRYSVQPWLAGKFFIRSNCNGAKNYQLLICDADDIKNGMGRECWKTIGEFPYESMRTISAMDVFKSHVAVYGRYNGLTRLWLLSLDVEAPDCVVGARLVEFEEDAYTVHGSVNKQFDSHVLRVTYSSLSQPPATIDLDVISDEKVIIKEKEIPNYDKTLYETRRIACKARDGTEIPMSVVYRTDKIDLNLSNPVMLYGYGSYGSCMEPDFAATRLPLLDRGMIYCIAHIRGGGEMGRYWYEDEGKYTTKLNTFHDFIDCAEYLVNEKWTSPDKLAINGRSAGGLLMGAVLNMRPDLFAVCIAGVPFVDLMATMCDSTIPLTVMEWEEWGNPNIEKYFDYMMQYSPMDNVTAQDYPATLVTAGLNDPRVAYWECCKWVAKLRDKKTNDKKLLLKTEMSAGHFSASDRYKYLRERAFEYAFLLNELELL